MKIKDSGSAGKLLAVILLCVLVVPGADGQQPTPKKKGNKVVRFLVGPWKALVTDWKFAAAMGAFYVGVALDGHSTLRVQNRRPGAVELNPFLPDHPRLKHILLFGGIYGAGQTYATWGMYRAAYDPEKPKSKFPLVVLTYPLALGTIHGLAARHNYNLVTCPSGFFKPPGRPGCLPRD